MRRTVGVLVLVVGAVVVAALLLYPTQLSVLGTTLSCGAPALTVWWPDELGPDSGDTARWAMQQCVQTSTLHCWLAVVVGVVCGAGGAVLVAMGRERRPVWNGQRWV